MARAHLRHGLLFCLPALLSLLCLTLYPMGASFYYSFCNYTALKPPRWVGLANYQRMLHDEILLESLKNTLYYASFSIPLGIAVAFALAMLLNAKVRGMALYRTLFYLPSIVPVVASAVLWRWVLNPDYGLINFLLRMAHIPRPGWLSDPAWSKPALILMSTWGVGGLVVIFLAGLQGVPQELYEAAEIDGASRWQRARHITVPMMSPYLFFSLVMGVIGASQYFTQAWVITNGTGAPANATLFYAMYLFQNAFQYFKMGYACAMAWILFVIILLATLFLFRTSARFVYYGEK